MEMNKEQLKEHFDQQIEKSQNAFNIFSALHKETDEKQLHSRFISYLLSFNDDFLEAFAKKILNIEDFEIEDNWKVQPKKEDKSEKDNIDIQIYNDKRIIIIENKIHSGDNNKRIKDGKVILKHQLESYYKDKSKKYKEENIDVVYLSLGDHHKPSEQTLGKSLTITNEPNKKQVKLINYTTHIPEWLDECQAIIKKEDDFLAKTINQYKELIIKLTSDIEKAKRNQKIISENITDAWKLQEHNKYFTKDCFEIFRHVQWHTVDDFFNKLIAKLKKENTKITEIPSLEDITKITDNKNQERRTQLIIRFTYNNVKLQIVNDTKGFTLGNLCEGKWEEFSPEINKIKFNNFSIKDTFRIINKDHRERVIKEIIAEAKNKYLNLENDFE